MIDDPDMQLWGIERVGKRGNWYVYQGNRKDPVHSTDTLTAARNYIKEKAMVSSLGVHHGAAGPRLLYRIPITGGEDL